MFYVYVWRDSVSVPFYVGKGKGNRAHSTNKRSDEFKAIYDLGGCTVEIVDWFIHESQAHAYEMELIERYGRRDIGAGTLVNKTDGGEGTSGALLVRSKETRARMSAAARRRFEDPAARSEISDRQRKRFEDPAAREKMAASTSARRPEVKEKMRAYASNRSDEHRANLGAAQRRRFESQEERAKIGDRTRGTTVSEEMRDRIARAIRSLPIGCRNTSGYKGVSFDKARNKWGAFMRIDGKSRGIGRFDTPEEAAKAYDRAVVEAFGAGNVYTNFEVASQ